MRDNVLVLVSRLGVAAMRTHYHVEQDGHRLANRFPRRRTAWTMAIRLIQGAPRGPVARCALRWESLSGRPAVERRPADRPAPRMRMLVVPLPVSLLYLYACKVLTLIYIYIDTALSSARACNRGYHVWSSPRKLVQLEC